MSLDFEASQTDQLTTDSVVQIRDYPITMACWAKVESHPATQETGLMGVSQRSGDNFFQLGLYDLLGGDDSAAGFVNDGGTVDIYAASATVSTGGWQHYAATWTDPTTRKVFYNGTGDTDTGSGTFDPSGENQFTLGFVWFSGTRQFHYDGLMTHATIWRAVLSDEEIDALAGGLHPMLVRPTLQWGSWSGRDFWQGIDYNSISNKSEQPSWAFSAHGNGDHGLCATLESGGSGAGLPSTGTSDFGPSQVYGFTGPL